MISLRSGAFSTWSVMSLLGTSFSVSVSHLSSVSSVHLTLDFLSASEYWNESTDPAVRPYTPLRRGPSLSRSSAWHPPQRFSNSDLPSAWACARAGTKRLHPAAININPARIVPICRLSTRLLSFQRGVHHGQAVLLHHRFHVGNPEHAPQFVIRDFHWAGSLGCAGSGLRERRRHRRVERDIAFHLLHHLVDVPVQHCDRSEPLEVTERLCAVLGPPAPVRINRPQRDMREDDHRTAGGLALEVRFQPLDLFAAQFPKSFKCGHVG